VVNEYTDWERPVQHPINIRDETMEAMGDAQVVAPLVRTGDFHSIARPSNSFFYVFDYQTKFGDFPQVCQKALYSTLGLTIVCVYAGAPSRVCPRVKFSTSPFIFSLAIFAWRVTVLNIASFSALCGRRDVAGCLAAAGCVDWESKYSGLCSHLACVCAVLGASRYAPILGQICRRCVSIF
jgi:hypothetical protein